MTTRRPSSVRTVDDGTRSTFSTESTRTAASAVWPSRSCGSVWLSTTTPGAGALTPGTPFVMIFQIVEVMDGREITGVGRPGPTRRFGPIACSYRVTPHGSQSRLIGRLDLTVRRLAAPIAWRDLAMMRKQLLILAACAERSA